MVEVTVSRLGLDASSSAFVVVLEDKAGERALPIWIGRPEAEAIAAHINGVKRERPMTHDLAQQIVLGLGGLLRRVQVTHVQDGTYHAELHLTRGGQPVIVDARPSDAIALALRLQAPIFVAESLFSDDAEEEFKPGDARAGGEDDHLSGEELKRHLAQLRPEDFGRFTP
ncbi:MAG: bifunctional nuclease family protein, partial [Gemmatimonadota bacterium]|nr:bifunctional nuclease family protein [Gemmatimonadota bacterium]